MNREGRMNSISARVLAGLMLLLVSNCCFGQSPEFFGMHLRNRKDMNFWPEVPFRNLRLHDAGVSWREIETAPGHYDWSVFDAQLKRARKHDVDILYDFVRTPEFYASKSQCGSEFNGGQCNASSCAEYGGKNLKGCFPSDDLNRDGSGRNQHFKAFVTALVNHVASLDPSGYASVTTWEIWNEFDNEPFWQGTYEQLLRMSKDARAIIKARFPSAVVTTPNAILPRMLRQYLALPGAAKAADALSIHAYIPHCDPEEFMEKRLHVFSELRRDYSGKPIYITEASWAKEKNCPDRDQQAAFTARYLLLMYGGIGQLRGIDRLWWYGYDYGTGHLADPDTEALQPAGRAYAEVHGWVTSHKMVPHSCKPDSGLRWSCALSGPNGYEALIVWDTDPGRECSDGNCPTSRFSPAGRYKFARDIAGRSMEISGSVAIGARPVLLEKFQSFAGGREQITPLR